MKRAAAGTPKSVHEVPPIRLYSFNSCAGSSTCEGPQFCAVPVVPCAQTTIGRPAAGAAPAGAITSAVDSVGRSRASEER